MAVGLRYSIAVSGTSVRALPISIDDSGIRLRMFVLEPAQQGRPKVEADARIVVHNSFPARSRISYADAGICLVTLGMDALVPIMERRSAGLDLDDSGPGILARRLVEMAVNNECGHGLIRTQATKRHKRLRRTQKDTIAQTNLRILLYFLWLYIFLVYLFA